MPPKKKGDESKKTQQKKKQQILEDKTFGLKNKNKSKKVQQTIKSIEKSVMNTGDRKLRMLEEQRKKAKAEAKLRKKAAKEEQDALFGEALLAIQKKGGKTIDKTAGKVEAKGRDADDDENNKKSTSRAMKMMYQMDAQEMNDKLREDPNYVPTLEDEIEMERMKLRERLKKEGKTGTPVTPETFAIWQDNKRKKHAEEMKKRVEMEMKKKKGGKGLSVLSGKDLYEYKRELFNKDNDDDDDVDNDVDNMKEGPTGTSRQSSTISDSNNNNNNNVENVTTNIQQDLFLQDDNVDDLDDLDDD